MFALPLLHRVLPAAPWVFLYRDPVEVLVSHQRRAGLQALPGVVPVSLFGVGGAESVLHADYAAWLMGRLCAAALTEMPEGAGLRVNYRDLPDAVFASILPQFGMPPDDAERAAMAAAGLRDAKTPNRSFTPDAAAKHAEATMATRDAANRLMSAVYQHMESMRLGNG